MTGIHTGVPSRGGHLQPDSHGSLIHQASLTLTDVQARALRSAPFELAPTPGADRMTVATLAEFYHRWVADFTNIDAAATISIGAAGELVSLLEATGNGVSNVLANGEDMLARFVVRPDSATYPATIYKFPVNLFNKPLLITATNGVAGDFTGGDGSEVLVSAEFRVWDRTLGKYLTVAESGWDEHSRTFTA